VRTLDSPATRKQAQGTRSRCAMTRGWVRRLDLARSNSGGRVRLASGSPTAAALGRAVCCCRSASACKEAATFLLIVAQPLGGTRGLYPLVHTLTRPAPPCSGCGVRSVTVCRGDGRFIVGGNWKCVPVAAEAAPGAGGLCPVRGWPWGAEPCSGPYHSLDNRPAPWLPHLEVSLPVADTSPACGAQVQRHPGVDPQAGR
jgi:hypothetical protein